MTPASVNSGQTIIVDPVAKVVVLGMTLDVFPDAEEVRSFCIVQVQGV